jgi:hypothetical protein
VALGKRQPRTEFIWNGHWQWITSTGMQIQFERERPNLVIKGACNSPIKQKFRQRSGPKIFGRLYIMTTPKKIIFLFLFNMWWQRTYYEVLSQIWLALQKSEPINTTRYPPLRTSGVGDITNFLWQYDGANLGYLRTASRSFTTQPSSRGVGDGERGVAISARRLKKDLVCRE